MILASQGNKANKRGPQPGYPNSATLDGYGAMMEVAYVAQYVSV